MRRFVVWAVVNKDEVILEMPDTATDKECEEACEDTLQTLISNGDTGWTELALAEKKGSES